MKAVVGREDDDSTQVLLEIDNHTTLPPRYLDGVYARFYFNISEMLDAGYTFDDLLFNPQYDSLSSNTNGEYSVTYEVVQYNDKGDCYVELHWPACRFYGTEQYQFALVNSAYVKIWDSSNDYSTSQIPTAEELGLELGKAPQFTDVVTMYVDGEKVWGTEPEDAPHDIPGAVAYGDTDCNGTVALLDVILLNKNLLGMVELSDDGAVNADVDLSGKPDSTDSLYILQSLVSLVTLPVRK